MNRSFRTETKKKKHKTGKDTVVHSDLIEVEGVLCEKFSKIDLQDL